MQQGAATHPQQISIVIPAPHDIGDVENRLLPVFFVTHGDDTGRQYEDRHLRGEQLRLDGARNLGTQRGRVHRHERVGGVSGGLRPFAVFDDIFHRALVEAECVGQFGEQGGGGVE